MARPNDADCGDEGILGVALLDITGDVGVATGVMVIEAGALVEGIIGSIPSFIFSAIDWVALIARGGDGG